MAEGTMVQEHDFTVAMATAKGHTLPVETRPFTCQGCGASFLLEPVVLSLNCTYCGSSHVVELPESRRLITPEGVIPLELSQQEAHKALRDWFTQKGLQGKAKVTPPRGVYVPAWTFDLSGEYGSRSFSDLMDASKPCWGTLQQQWLALLTAQQPVYCTKVAQDLPIF